MATLPVAWTVHNCAHGGDGVGLLKGGDAANPNLHVPDLFHEDAQVGVMSCLVFIIIVCIDDILFL